ncbi:MAG TPA: molybdenum cofactor biosynthesis protein MoaE [Gemmatimonadaceae bacterium]|nr:molybdenum cofactor biosynthesis protein MoaE [Gemmatimonadaceae bacterium]
MRALLTREPIDSTALLERVAGRANGATVLFIGTVREVNEGRAVTGIEYSAYESMAQRELSAIVEDASARYGTPHVVVVHRLGELMLGEASVAVAVAHPRRAPAFDAARFVIEQLKKRVPIWKLEHYVDGTREWVNAGTAHR